MEKSADTARFRREQDAPAGNHVKKELPHFQIGSAYGGSQNWFTNPLMRLGGCGAATACDCCVDLDLYFSTHLYPFAQDALTRKDYVAFSNVMKPYLHPRWKGIDTLELFMEGFRGYLSDSGEDGVFMEPLSGTKPYQDAQARLVEQIDGHFPVPYLNLNHRNPAFRDYGWHWFLLNGYERWEDTLMVKAVTYGNWRWLDFRELWDTGRPQKGGMVLLSSPKYHFEEKK